MNIWFGLFLYNPSPLKSLRSVPSTTQEVLSVDPEPFLIRAEWESAPPPAIVASVLPSAETVANSRLFAQNSVDNSSSSLKLLEQTFWCSDESLNNIFSKVLDKMYYHILKEIADIQFPYRKGGYVVFSI